MNFQNIYTAKEFSDGNGKRKLVFGTFKNYAQEHKEMGYVCVQKYKESHTDTQEITYESTN